MIVGRDGIDPDLVVSAASVFVTKTRTLWLGKWCIPIALRSLINNIILVAVSKQESEVHT